MKLEILQETFVKGLSKASRLVASRAQLPILTNILLTAKKEGLKLSATDLETGINLWLGAKVEKEGAVAIPARLLTEFVSSLPPGKISLETENNSLKISAGFHQAEIIGTGASEFPVVPSLKKKPDFNFDSSELIKAVGQVIFAASQDEGRPVLTGVLLTAQGRDLVLVATDGYRLSLKKIPGVKKIVEAKEIKEGLLVPARVLGEVVRVMSEDTQEKLIGLTVTPKANQLIFSTSKVELISRLLEGKFPEFGKIIPQEALTEVRMETSELIKVVRLASIFARESANIVKFRVLNNKLQVSADAPQIGNNLNEMEVEVKGEETKIAFNSRYLLDFLTTVAAKEVILKMSGPLNPGVFVPAGDSSLIHLIMPVRIQEEE